MPSARRDRRRPRRHPPQRARLREIVAWTGRCDDDRGQGRRLRPRHGRGRARRPRGRRRLARRRHPGRGAGAARRRRHGPGAVLADGARRGLRRSRGRRHRRDGVLRRRARRDRSAGGTGRAPGSSSRSTPGCPAAARRAPTGRTCSRSARPRARRAASRITGIWSHFAASDEPDHPANDAQEAAFRGGARARRRGRPATRRCATSPTRRPRSCAPSARFDLVRCGIAAYGLDPAPGVSPPTSGCVPAMTVRRRLALVKRDRRRRRRLLRPHLGRRPRPRPGPGARRVRRGHAARRRQPRQVWVGGRQPRGPRPGLHGPVHRRPRRRRRRPPATTWSLFGPGPAASRPRRTGPRRSTPSTTRSSPGSAADWSAVTSTARTTGAGSREPRPQDHRRRSRSGRPRRRRRGRSDRPPHRVIGNRAAGDETPFGSLRSAPLDVVADDGDRPARRDRRARRLGGASRRPTTP